jgi:hypothetical protein
VGSIPIARSTFRCLACLCVVLGRDLAYRPVPTVSTPTTRPTTTVPLIECVDRPLGRVRSRGSHRRSSDRADNRERRLWGCPVSSSLMSAMPPLRVPQLRSRSSQKPVETDLRHRYSGLAPTSLVTSIERLGIRTVRRRRSDYFRVAGVRPIRRRSVNSGLGGDLHSSVAPLLGSLLSKFSSSSFATGLLKR